jgi:hypothetical protein
MKLPFLRAVVPPHVFCLQPEGITYLRVRSEPPVGFADVRHARYPGNSVGAGSSGTPVFTREAFSESVETARRSSGGRLSRASVVFPDSWARILPVEFETLPESEEARRDMVVWKLKKLLPGVSAELSVVFDEMPPVGQERRLLVAAAPAETLRSIEQSFESLGVRVGGLAPSSLVLVEGLAPTLSERSPGDWALVHRSLGSLVLVIARDGGPLFFRQRPIESEEEDHEQEVRLSISYYSEKLHGPGLSAVYVHDEVPDRRMLEIASFPRPPVPISGLLFQADSGFDERVSARPELLPGFAAVYGRV